MKTTQNLTASKNSHKTKFLRIGLPIVLLLFLVSVFEVQAKSIQKPVLWGKLEMGRYRVGFKTKTLIDRNRKNLDQDKNGRPIEVMIWYPAKAKANTGTMTFKDYVALLTNFRKGSSESDMQDWLATSVSGDSKGVEKVKLNEILESKMFASKNSKAINNKRFPLILWTMRHETFIAQSVLCEFLASNGYVVASARYAKEPLPFPWAIKTAADKLEVFSTHLQDLEFVLETLSAEINTHPKKVAIMNWSYAAELSPAIQMKNSKVKLVIGLSSNPLSSFGLYQGSAAAARLKIDKLTVPYVILSEQIGADGKDRLAPKILNELATESFYVKFPQLTHGNFNLLEGMIPGVFGIEKVQSWSKGGSTAKIGYEAISQYSLLFLDKYLKSKNKLSQEKLHRKFPKNFTEITHFRKK